MDFAAVTGLLTLGTTLLRVQDDQSPTGIDPNVFFSRIDAWRAARSKLQTAIAKLDKERVRLQTLLQLRGEGRQFTMKDPLFHMTNGSHTREIHESLLESLSRQPALIEFDRIHFPARDYHVLHEADWCEGQMVVMHGPGKYSTWHEYHATRLHHRFPIIDQMRHAGRTSRPAHLYTGGFEVVIQIQLHVVHRGIRYPKLTLTVPPNNWVDLRGMANEHSKRHWHPNQRNRRISHELLLDLRIPRQ